MCGSHMKSCLRAPDLLLCIQLMCSQYFQKIFTGQAFSASTRFNFFTKTLFYHVRFRRNWLFFCLWFSTKSIIDFHLTEVVQLSFPIAVHPSISIILLFVRIRIIILLFVWNMFAIWVLILCDIMFKHWVSFAFSS